MQFQKRLIDSSYQVTDNSQKFTFSLRLAEAMDHMLRELSALNGTRQFSVTCYFLAKRILDACSKMKAYASRAAAHSADLSSLEQVRSTADRVCSDLHSSLLASVAYLQLPTDSSVYGNELLDLLLANAAFKLKYNTDQ
jgi:hypothetical protein